MEGTHYSKGTYVFSKKKKKKTLLSYGTRKMAAFAQASNGLMSLHVARRHSK